MFGFIAWSSWKATGRIVQHGISTVGIVEKLEKRARKIGETGSPTSVAPVVLYLTKEGQQMRYYSTTYSSLELYAPGDSVQLWYLPEHPQTATLEGPDSWILALSFGAFGAILLSIGFPWLAQLVLQQWRARASVH